MLILKQAGERTGARVVVLGTFDGVHLGHQELIRRGRIVSQSAGIPLRVFTFDRHPLAVIRPGKQPPLLTTLAEKAERMDACGVDELRVLSFDQRMADTPPGDFLRLLREEQEIRAIVAGWNYTFGSKGAGTADRLLEDGRCFGYEVIIVPPVVTEKGEIISSSAIREKLAQGNVTGAAEMLGAPYSLRGTLHAERLQGPGERGNRFLFQPDSGKALPGPGRYECRVALCGNTFSATVTAGREPRFMVEPLTGEARQSEGTARLTLLRGIA